MFSFMIFVLFSSEFLIINIDQKVMCPIQFQSLLVFMGKIKLHEITNITRLIYNISLCYSIQGGPQNSIQFGYRNPVELKILTCQ
jgi:hypothetical protein